jgi:hypothetical protein
MIFNIRELKLKFKRKYMIPIVRLNIWLKVYKLKKMVLLLIVTLLMVGCQTNDDKPLEMGDTIEELLITLQDIVKNNLLISLNEDKILERLDTIDEHQSYDEDMVCLTKSIVGLQNQLGDSLNYLIYQDDVIKYSFRSVSNNLIGEHTIDYMIWNCGRDWDYETIKN